MASLSIEEMKKKVQEIMNSMEEDGMVDHLFARIYVMKASNGPLFFANLLPTFCRDSATTLRDITVALDQPVLNNHQLDQMCIKVKGSAASIGACRFSLSCAELQQVIKTEVSKESHITALNAAKHELSLLKPKMDTIVQLEKWIADKEGPRRP